MSTELTDDYLEVLSSAKRLADLEASGLLDSPPVGALDALVLLAQTAIGADITVLITAITEDSQVIISRAGGRQDRLPPGPMPLTQSMCKFVVMDGTPDVIADTAADPSHELVVRGLDIAAYLGFPLKGPRGTALGAVCAVSAEPRAWNATEVQTLQSLTTAAEFVVGMLAMARRNDQGLRGPVPIERHAQIQHSLRTPLTGLRASLDLLLEGHLGDLSDEQADTLRRCRDNAHRLCAEVEAL